MADTKITALTALTAADPANDVLPIVDVSDTTMAASGTTKKISVNNILGCSGTATLASATITGDLTVDTSTLKVDSANNRVGIGTASPTAKLQLALTGSGSAITRVNSFGNDGTFGFPSPATNSAGVFFGMGVDQNSPSAGFGFFRESTGWNTAIAFYTNNQTGGPNIDTITERLRLNSDGNLGLGVTPSAWSSNGNIQLPANGMLTANGNLYLLGNAYYNTNFKYTTSAAASQYAQGAGAHYWYTAPSGTAGNAITFTQAMTLDESGNLLVGTTSQVGRLTVRTATDNTTVAQFGATNRQVNFTTSSNGGIDNGFFNFVSTSVVGAFSFQNANGTLWQVDSVGNMIPQITGTAPTLSANSQMVFNLTSNTNLRISVRGTDGTTRTANITLA